MEFKEFQNHTQIKGISFSEQLLSNIGNHIKLTTYKLHKKQEKINVKEYPRIFIFNFPHSTYRVEIM